MSVVHIPKIQGLGQAVGAVNKLIDALDRVTVIESPTVKPSYSGGGISLRVKESRGARGGSTFEIKGDEELYKVCSLRLWGVPESTIPALTGSQMIPVSGDPFGYYDYTLEPTWDYLRFTTPALSGG